LQPVTRQVGGHTLGQVGHRALGRRVRRYVGARQRGLHAGDVANLLPPAAYHVSRASLPDMEHAGAVGLQEAFKHIRGKFLQQGAWLHARVVDQDVYRAVIGLEPLNRRSGQRPTRGLPGGAAASRRHGGRFVVGDVENKRVHRGARAAQRLGSWRQRETDPHGRTGSQRGAPV
jgi:hypothetical protein